MTTPPFNPLTIPKEHVTLIFPKFEMLNWWHSRWENGFSVCRDSLDPRRGGWVKIWGVAQAWILDNDDDIDRNTTSLRWRCRKALARRWLWTWGPPPSLWHYTNNTTTIIIIIRMLMCLITIILSLDHWPVRLVLNPGRPVSCRWNLGLQAAGIRWWHGWYQIMRRQMVSNDDMMTIINHDDDLFLPPAHIYSSTGPCTPRWDH